MFFLGVHVCWVFAKMPLHITKSLPQRDGAAAVSGKDERELPLEIVAACAVHVADEPFTGTAICLLVVILFRSVLLARQQWGSRQRSGAVGRDSVRTHGGDCLCAPSVAATTTPHRQHPLARHTHYGRFRPRYRATLFPWWSNVQSHCTHGGTTAGRPVFRRVLPAAPGNRGLIFGRIHPGRMNAV